MITLYPYRAVYLYWTSSFLAAMSSSRSDVVTQFVFSFVFLFVCVSLFFLLLSLKVLLVLKSVNGVSMQFKECLKFNRSFKEVLRVF